MDATPNSGSSFGLMSIIIALAGLTAIYFLYTYLYGGMPGGNTLTKLVEGKTSAAVKVEKPPQIPVPFEGGEYSFTTWIYVSSFNKNRNTRKHIFELKGTHFSTLVVALGAFKNTLVVRTHNAVEAFQATGTAPTSAGSTPTSTTPPNAGSTTGNLPSLAARDLTTMFAPLAMDDDLVTTPPMCDLPEIDLQRWVMVTVVLTGRTIDVYLDGKLARSCVMGSYYKVDPTGVTANICDRGGFDGYIAGMSVANYAMNPDEIYRAYTSGPEGASNDVFKWIGGLFKGST
jgi:hypothetical protein